MFLFVEVVLGHMTSSFLAQSYLATPILASPLTQRRLPQMTLRVLSGKATEGGLDPMTVLDKVKNTTNEYSYGFLERIND